MFDTENEYTPLVESLPFDSSDDELFNTEEYLNTLDTNDIPF